MASQFADLVERLAEDRLPELVREDSLGELNFGLVVTDLRVIRKILQGLTQQPVEEIPDRVRRDAEAKASALDELLDRIAEFTLAQDQAATQHKQIVDGIQGHKTWFVEQVRPHIRALELDTSGKLSELHAAVERSKEAAAEIEEILGNLRASSGTTGANRLSSHYEQRAQDHGKSARRYLVGAGMAVVITFVGILIFFVIAPPTFDSNTNTALLWGHFFRALVFRLLLLGVLTYVVTFTVRNYRTERHLQILNDAKQSALDTYAVFQEATSDESSRAILLNELVRSVFAVPDSGLVGLNAERTTIETVPTLSAILGSRVE